MKAKLALKNIVNIVKDHSESIARIEAIKQKFDYSALKKVRISVKDSTFSKFIKLQTPGQLGVTGRTAFVSVLNPDINLVVNKPNPWLPLSKHVEKNWMLHIEPPGYIVKLGLASHPLINKFDRVYTSAPHLYEQGGRFIASPPYVHWHLALSSYANNQKSMAYDFDFLTQHDKIPEKEISLVAINSKINDLPGHKLRANFIAKISDNNLNYELYGASNWSAYKQYKGPAADGKWPVYSKSKYVLAIENEVSDYYWIEKFTDAILCYSMPIYYGSPKINNYFPEGSYIPLDITKPSAIDDLRAILASDFYEKNIHNLIEARNRILLKHNMFSFIDQELNNTYMNNF